MSWRDSDYCTKEHDMKAVHRYICDCVVPLEPELVMTIFALMTHLAQKQLTLIFFLCQKSHR